MSGVGTRLEEQAGGVLEGEGAGKCLKGGGLDGGVDVEGFEQESAHFDMLDEASEDQAVPTDGGLIESELSAGIDMGEHAPAEVYGSKHGALHAEKVVCLGVDPHTPLEAGQCFRGGVGGRPAWVGGVVEHDLMRAVGGLDLGLAGTVSVEHRVRHELDEVGGQLFAGLIGVGVPGEHRRRGDHVIESGTLGLILFFGERLAVFQDEAGDGSVPGLDDVADAIAFFIEGVHAIAQVGIGVPDGADLVGCDVGDQGAWRGAQQTGRGAWRGCVLLLGGAGLRGKNNVEGDSYGREESQAADLANEVWTTELLLMTRTRICLRCGQTAGSSTMSTF